MQAGEELVVQKQVAYTIFSLSSPVLFLRVLDWNFNKFFYLKNKKLHYLSNIEFLGLPQLILIRLELFLCWNAGVKGPHWIKLFLPIFVGSMLQPKMLYLLEGSWKEFKCFCFASESSILLIKMYGRIDSCSNHFSKNKKWSIVAY